MAWQPGAGAGAGSPEALDSADEPETTERYEPNRVISGAPPPMTVPAIWSRLMSAVVEMPCTFSLNSSTLRRPAQRFFVRDQPLLEEAEDRLVERLHAVLRRARGDRAVDQVGLFLVDDAVADEGVLIMTSTAGARPLPSMLRHQALRDDRLEHAGELQADLLLLVRREDGDDAVDRFGRVERVQRREHEVAGFGREQAGLDRLEVAHLADEDDVGILPQGAAQRLRERARVDRHLALVDDRLAVAVEELDRILDRHHVRAARAC